MTSTTTTTRFGTRVGVTLIIASEDPTLRSTTRALARLDELYLLAVVLDADWAFLEPYASSARLDDWQRLNLRWGKDVSPKLLAAVRRACAANGLHASATLTRLSMQSPLVVEMVPVLLATGAVVLGGRRQSGGGGLYRLLSLLRDWKTDREAARLTNERTAAENDALISLLDESSQSKLIAKAATLTHCPPHCGTYSCGLR